MDYALADRTFDSVIAADQEHPSGYFFKAMVNFWRAITNTDNTGYDEAYRQQLDLAIEKADKRLEENEFEVNVALDGENGLFIANNTDFAIIILDIMLPKINGLEVCKEIRKKSNVPILMLTALGTSENIANGLNMGADDYLVKPFKFIELFARINSQNFY